MWKCKVNKPFPPQLTFFLPSLNGGIVCNSIIRVANASFPLPAKTGGHWTIIGKILSQGNKKEKPLSVFTLILTHDVNVCHCVVSKKRYAIIFSYP